MALDVLGTHVDDALHAEACRNRGRGHAMHACAGLGDHSLLAHAARQEGLADGVVDLVGASMVQVFPLQVDLSAAQNVGQTTGVVDGAGSAHVMFQLMGELGLELGIVAEAQILLAQFFHRRDQGLGHVDAAIGAEVAALIWIAVSQRFQPL